MASKNSPTDIWTVVDIAFNGWNVVSSHQSQQDANAIDATMGWRGEGTPRAWPLHQLPNRWGAHAGETLHRTANRGRGCRSRSQSPPSAARRHCGVG